MKAVKFEAHLGTFVVGHLSEATTLVLEIPKIVVILDEKMTPNHTLVSEVSRKKN